MSMLSRNNRIDKNGDKCGADFVLFVTPRVQHWNKKECPKNCEKDLFSLNDPFQYEYFRFFEEVKDQLSYDVVNLLPAFQATDEFPLVFEADPHWNVRGHNFVGRTLAYHLLGNKLLK